jgi:hypothetical protein
MTDLSLNKDMNLEVTAKFIGKGHDSGLLDDHTVRLYDEDIFGDDYLGESRLQDGVARINFTHKSFGDALNLENKPDFYFVVYKNKEQVFKTKVLINYNLKTIETFKMGEGAKIDLGTFLID